MEKNDPNHQPVSMIIFNSKLSVITRGLCSQALFAARIFAGFALSAFSTV